jgi:hypothetical protein
VLQQETTYRSLSKSDAIGQILRSALRGINIECKRASTSVHLTSADKAQVDSLLQALDQIMKTQLAIRRHLETETGRAAAPNLLRDLIADTKTLHGGLWPEYYRSCEVLTRLLDILESTQSSLSILS